MTFYIISRVHFFNFYDQMYKSNMTLQFNSAPKIYQDFIRYRPKNIPFFFFLLTLTLSFIFTSVHAHPPDAQGIQSFNPNAPDRMDISVLARSSELYLVGFYIELNQLYADIHTPESDEQVDWRPARPMFERFTRSLVRIHADDETIEAVVKFPNLEQTGLFDTTRGDFVELQFTVPKNTKNITLTVNALVKKATVGIMDPYRPQKIELTEDSDHFVILRGDASISAQDSPTEQAKALKEGTRAQTFIIYVKEGFLHILPAGVDHILFVLGLFLLSTRWTILLVQVSLFTIAHTFTLALSTLGIFNLPATVVEPLIALSIAYVAIENLMTDELKKSRAVVVFFFGLLHGLGFAGVLSELGLSKSYFVLSLLSFNIGVEIGQLTVLVGALSLVYWFRKRPIYRSLIVKPGSVLIATIGLWWGIERIIN